MNTPRPSDEAPAFEGGRILAASLIGGAAFAAGSVNFPVLREPIPLLDVVTNTPMTVGSVTSAVCALVAGKVLAENSGA